MNKSPGGIAISQFHDKYDDAGDIRKKDTEHGTYAYGTYAYSYDKLDRLTGPDNPLLANEAFTYDQVGNRFQISAYNYCYIFCLGSEK